jgi:hypothetical protein
VIPKAVADGANGSAKVPDIKVLEAKAEEMY